MTKGMWVIYIYTGLFSKVLHWRRRVSPRRPIYLLIVELDYCVMRFAFALHVHHQNLVLLSCLPVYTEPFELVIEIVFHYCTTPPCHQINVFKRPFRGCQAFGQPIECRGQLGTRSWDQKTQSWLSQSYHWVNPEHTTPSLLLLVLADQTSLITNPTPLGKWPHPLHKKPSISTRFFMFYRVGVINWALLIKENIKQWAPVSIQQWTFKSFIDEPQTGGPHPRFPQRVTKYGSPIVRTQAVGRADDI